MDISIIIPVYNVEKYLRRCLDSVLQQKNISMEIILVDDGSTDSSSNFCEEYVACHSNIKCIHIENSGPSTAKNIGYNEATGKYVCSICGYVYDPAKGDPEHGIPVGTKFEDLPTDWHCPRCKQPKDKFGEA